MRLRLKTRTPGQIEFGMIYTGIAVTAIALVRFLPIDRILPTCMFKGLFGIPCPTCGATRSAMFFSHGELMHAVAMNPLVSLCLFFACLSFPYFLLAAALGFPRITIYLSDQEKDLAPAGVLAAVVLQWAYLILFL